MRARAFTSATLVVLTLSILASGCIGPFGHRKKKGEPDESEWENTSITVRVSNHNFLDVVVYALPAGARHRLGDVSSGREVTLVIPPEITMAGHVELLVDPVGTRETYQTGTIVVNPGQEIELTVENQLQISSWRVSLAELGERFLALL